MHGISEGITLIFASREEPPADMAPFQAAKRMECIEWKELRFTLNESKGIMKLRSKITQSNEIMQQIQNITHGWITGLILILLRAERKNMESLLANQYSLSEIFDYFAHEIVKKLDKPTRDFLLKTAFLPQMTTKMAKRLTDNNYAGRILSELNSKNCFLEKRHTEMYTYRYHPLFKDFLVNLAKAEFSAEEIAQLNYKAASLLEESNHVEDAAELYAETGTWDKLIQLIFKQAELLIRQGRNRVLEGWINSLPPEIHQESPWLIFWKGTCHLPFNPVEARGYFEKAYALFKKGNNVDGLFLSWSCIVDSFVHARRNLFLLQPWIEEMHNYLTRSPNFSSLEIEIRVTSRMFIALLHCLPKQAINPPLAEWAKRSEALMEHIPDFNQQMMISNFLVFYYCFQGKFTRAALILDKIKQWGQNKDVSPLILILWRMMEATYYCFIGNFEICHSIIEKGVKIAEDSGVYIYTPHLLSFAVYGTLVSFDLSAATKYLEKMASSVNKPGCYFYNGEYHYLIGWIAWLKNDFAQSIEHLEKALAVTKECGEIIGLMIAPIGLAQVLTECGQHQKAAYHLAQAKPMVLQSGNHWMEYKWLLARAQLALKGNKEKEGLHYLKKALSLSKEKGIVFFDFYHPSIMAKLCIRALEAGIEVKQAQEIIRKLKLIPDASSIKFEQWPWSLKIYTLGRSSVLKGEDGAPIQFTGKAQRKPIQMLKLLIALGGRNISEGKLSDVLWPDADGDTAHSAFSTTLYRLRKLLGNESLHLVEGNLILDMKYCWVDCFVFERILRQSDTAFEEGHKERTIGLMKKALQLYHGPFFPNDEGEAWSIVYRHRLRSKFIRYTGKLGSYLQEAGALREAVECFQRGIEVDGLAEEFYRQLMVCLHKCGQTSEAIAVYDRLHKILAATLKTKPSPKTVIIYNSLKKNNCKRKVRDMH